MYPMFQKSTLLDVCDVIKKKINDDVCNWAWSQQTGWYANFPLQLELTCQRDESFQHWMNWNAAHNVVANTKRAKIN